MFDLPKFGDGICLARTAELLNTLAVDRARLARNSVVVTGSNGKGSTATFCAGIARALGLRTGLFTSPHLYRFNERFQIDGTPIDDGDLGNLVSRVEEAISGLSRRLNQRFGAFEAMFALACLYFQERQCDFAVFEAGIGGRYDPVRLVGARTACVTSVDYEHIEWLGNSLELIASDKSDACASGGTIVYGENLQSLRSHLAEYNRYREVAALFVGDQIGIAGQSVSTSGQRFDFHFGAFDYCGVEMQLGGAFQFSNAAIAIALFLLWQQAMRLEVTPARIEAAVRGGLREARWPARLEVIREKPLTVIDVGHTPDGIRQSLAGLTAIHGPNDWILVLGVSRDKKADEIARALAPSFDTIICTSAHHKGADAAGIATVVLAVNPEATVHIAAEIADAVDLSRRLAVSRSLRIYVAGGLFLAIEYASVLRGGRAQDLRFL